MQRIYALFPRDLPSFRASHVIPLRSAKENTKNLIDLSQII